ncbi:MAG: hypothetical protein R3B90_00190 [Planctomycetaceae bacterium]
MHRIVTSADATGWRPTKGEVDRFGREIPDEEYQTKDFERVVALRARTKAIAKHLFDFMQKTDPMGKTLVFCVDQEHALEMRKELPGVAFGTRSRAGEEVPELCLPCHGGRGGHLASGTLSGSRNWRPKSLSS